MLTERTEGERSLIHRLFRDGRTEDRLVRESGISRQAVNKRKRGLLQRIRSELVIEGVA